MNVIAQLEFKLAYYDVSVQYVSHYTTVTLLPKMMAQILRSVFLVPHIYSLQTTLSQYSRRRLICRELLLFFFFSSPETSEEIFENYLMFCFNFNFSCFSFLVKIFSQEHMGQSMITAMLSFWREIGREFNQ